MSPCCCKATNHREEDYMSTEGKDEKKPANNHRVRDGLKKATGLFAEKSAIEHRVENNLDVIEAKAKAVAAKAKVAIAEKKREIEKRVDDARVGMHDKH
jgi:hypothetical protein